MLNSQLINQLSHYLQDAKIILELAGEAIPLKSKSIREEQLHWYYWKNGGWLSKGKEDTIVFYTDVTCEKVRDFFAL